MFALNALVSSQNLCEKCILKSFCFLNPELPQIDFLSFEGVKICVLSCFILRDISQIVQLGKEINCLIQKFRGISSEFCNLDTWCSKKNVLPV